MIISKTQTLKSVLAVWLIRLYSTSGGEISHQASHKDQSTMMLHGLPPRLMLIIGAAYAKAIKHHLIINLNLSKNLLCF